MTREIDSGMPAVKEAVSGCLAIQGAACHCPSTHVTLIATLQSPSIKSPAHVYFKGRVDSKLLGLNTREEGTARRR